MMETTFPCFYILQPSNKGPMLLRRLAGSEEILPTPDAMQSKDSSVREEIQNSIQASLSNVKLRDYNPLSHERGFHPKLNMLVKESLHFGSIPLPNRIEMSSEEVKMNSSNSNHLEASKLPTQAEKEANAEDKANPNETAEENIEAACITEEWEQMIIHEVGKSFSPTCISKPKFDNLVLLSPDNKPLDEKTCRILERLEAPRKHKTKKNSSTVLVANDIKKDACAPMKKLLVPFGTNNSMDYGFSSSQPLKKPLVPFGLNDSVDHGFSSSQPIKPSFHRMKRKTR